MIVSIDLNSGAHGFDLWATGRCSESSLIYGLICGCNHLIHSLESFAWTGRWSRYQSLTGLGPSSPRSPRRRSRGSPAIRCLFIGHDPIVKARFNLRGNSAPVIRRLNYSDFSDWLEPSLRNASSDGRTPGGRQCAWPVISYRKLKSQPASRRRHFTLIQRDGNTVSQSTSLYAVDKDSPASNFLHFFQKLFEPHLAECFMAARFFWVHFIFKHANACSKNVWASFFEFLGREIRGLQTWIYSVLIDLN